MSNMRDDPRLPSCTCGAEAPAQLLEKFGVKLDQFACSHLMAGDSISLVLEDGV